MRPVKQRRWPTILGLSLLAMYASWNVYWHATGRIPPSILSGLTGIPSPTTGGTRSVLALMGGDLLTSLYYNPMTLPILGLLTFTIAQVALKRRGDSWLAYAWIVTLGVAWVIKLLSPSSTW